MSDDLPGAPRDIALLACAHGLSYDSVGNTMQVDEGSLTQFFLEAERLMTGNHRPFGDRPGNVTLQSLIRQVQSRNSITG